VAANPFYRFQLNLIHYYGELNLFAISNSSLTFIIIRRTVEIVDGSFSGCEELSIPTEEGREHLTIDGYFLQSFDRLILIRYFASDDFVCILRTVEIIDFSCFSDCKSLFSASIESDSALRKIEFSAFQNSSLPSIVIPRTVEIISGALLVHEFRLWCSRQEFLLPIESPKNFD
jgi:hypothetical protein